MSTTSSRRSGSDTPEDDRLFAVEEPARRTRRPPAPPEGRVVRVVVDVAGIERRFDYVVPHRLLQRAGLDLDLGLMLRVPLHGRQVAAWVVEIDPDPVAGVELRAATKVSGIGPPGDLVELCGWAAWRWAGRLPTFLGAASPPTMIPRLPAASPRAATDVGARVGALVANALDEPVSVLRLPPAASPLEVIRAGAMRGHVLVVAPTFALVRSLADAMRRAGIRTAVHPDGWDRGAAGCSVVGTRTSVFAPVAGLGAIVVVDEHDEALQNEGSPTWHAREVAVERARRAGVPVALVSPAPTLEALGHAGGRVHTIERSRERNGWARLGVVDRREEDLARTGLYSPQLVRALQSDRRVVCVLNRTGRARLLACHRCGTLAACERCEAAVREPAEGGRLDCPRCGATRPVVCGHCGGTVMRQVRIGVTKAREQLEALLREPVDEVAGAGRRTGAAVPVRSPARVMVGTEAALQRVDRADVVAFLEFDQELGAPRYRAAEQALTLLARASRLVGGRAGEVLVQTRQPDHEVLRAALVGDPEPFTAAEAVRRGELAFPPAVTLVAIGGEGAPAFMEGLLPLLDGRAVVDQPEVGQWIVRHPDRQVVLDAVSAVRRAPGRLRLQVDPARLPD